MQNFGQKRTRLDFFKHVVKVLVVGVATEFVYKFFDVIQKVLVFDVFCALFYAAFFGITDVIDVVCFLVEIFKHFSVNFLRCVPLNKPLQNNKVAFVLVVQRHHRRRYVIVTSQQFFKGDKSVNIAHRLQQRVVVVIVRRQRQKNFVRHSLETNGLVFLILFAKQNRRRKSRAAKTFDNFLCNRTIGSIKQFCQCRLLVPYADGLHQLLFCLLKPFRTKLKCVVFVNVCAYGV